MAPAMKWWVKERVEEYFDGRMRTAFQFQESVYHNLLYNIAAELHNKFAAQQARIDELESGMTSLHDRMLLNKEQFQMYEEMKNTMEMVVDDIFNQLSTQAKKVEEELPPDSPLLAIDLAAIFDSSPRLNYKLSPASWESIAKELDEHGSIAKAISFDDDSPNTSSSGTSGLDSGTDELPSKRHKAA